MSQLEPDANLPEPWEGANAGVCIHRMARRDCEVCDLADRLEQAEAERDEARYAARLLEHAYEHDSRPSADALKIIRAWGGTLTP